MRLILILTALLAFQSAAATEFDEMKAAAEASKNGKSTPLTEFKEAQRCFLEYNQAQNWLSAEACSKRSLSIGLELFDEGSKNLTSLRHNHGLILAKNKDYESAILLLKSVADDYRGMHGEQSDILGWLLLDLANAETHLQIDDSYKNYREAFEILASLKSEDPLLYADLVLQVSRLLSRNKLNRRAYSVAQGFAEEAYSLFSQDSNNPLKLSLSAFMVGKFMFYRKDYDNAIPMLQIATKHTSSAPYAHGLLATIYSETGRKSLASEHQGSLKGHNESRGQEKPWVPVFVPAPEYPRRAQKRGIEGYAIVELTITESGSVSNVELVEESPPQNGFGSAALKAAKKLKYTPRIVNGQAQKVPGVLYKFTFAFRK
jgi:TonB family protein